MAKKQAKKRRQKKHRKFWFGFKIFLLTFLVTILIGGIVLYFKYGDDIFAMQDEARALVQASSSETFRSSETTIAYNSKGKQIAVIKGDKDAYYVSLDNIPDYVKNAMICTEDKKFYEHNGIDFKGIMRAVWALIKNNGEKTQGASTITQQLARGVFLNTDKTYERKIKEIFIAQELERKYTKDQILEYYLNTICFANGYYGIEAAARGYFSKSCQDLSLAQLCFLCAIPNNPTLYDPEKKFDNTVKRKNRILDQMLSDGVINQVEYDEAYNEEIKLKIQEVKMRDYIQSFISYSATKALMKKNGFEFKYSFESDSERDAYEEEYDEAYDTAQQMLKNNGYRIYTSIDLTKQKKLQSAINENLSSFKEKGTDGMYEMQGSAVCIDNKTGRVVAIVGGRSQKTQGYSLNRAFQSYRQPGSTIKPIIVYTPTLERGSTANTTVNDHRFQGGPQNSSGRYYGYVSLRFAVEQSLNTVAWQLFQKLTPEVGLDYLTQMNFNRIVKSDYYLPASLGGLTHGVSA
ncbi:MAG: penicillin-binding protein, partial [Eubacterium sp.]|nr:penicillin-binding protein [Eubacterium sp.]